MHGEFTYDTGNNGNNVNNNCDKNPFYYYYRSESEKQKLKKLFCTDIKLFYETVCLYEKNKDNPNCSDLFKYLKYSC